MVEAVKDHSRERFAMKGFAAGVIEAAILIYPFVTHPVQAKNAMDALGQGYLDCGPRLLVETAQGILVPGGGMTGDFVPNKHEEERLMAAAILFAQNPNLHIFLLDGPPDPRDSSQGQGVIDYLQYAYKFVTQSENEIPQDKIVRGTTSINTATNMKEAHELARELDLESFLLVTQSYHMDRSVLFACNNGLHVSPRLVEELLAENLKNHDHMLQRQYPMGIELKEVTEVGLAYFDPKGEIPTYLKARARGEIGDAQHTSRRSPFPKEIWHEKILTRNTREQVVFRRNGKR